MQEKKNNNLVSRKGRKKKKKKKKKGNKEFWEAKHKIQDSYIHSEILLGSFFFFKKKNNNFNKVKFHKGDSTDSHLSYVAAASRIASISK